MDKQAFLSFYPDNKDAEIFYDAIVEALKELNIYSDLTMLGSLATARIEVGKAFKPIMEIASGKAYEGRADLGNVEKGDGVKFKGRGYIQLTGRANYKYYGDKLGLDLINKPELALDVKNSARILALYFKDRKVNVACEAKDWVKVRKLVNGGRNGLDEFLSVIEQYIAKQPKDKEAIKKQIIELINQL